MSGGGHSFPSGYINYDQDSLTSLYIKDYRGLPGDRTARIQRKSQPLPSLPFDASTTSKTDFPVWPHKPVQSFKPKPDVNKAPVPFQGNSNYRQDFAGARGEVRESYKPVPGSYHNTPFDGTTTSRLDFQPHTNVERARSFVPPRNTAGVAESRTFLTEASAAFETKPNAVRRSFKPSSGSLTRAPEDRTFETENRGQLHFFSDAKPSASFKPAVNADMMPENRDFKSEARSNYGTKTGPPAAIVRPSRTTIESLPFDATTTARTDFPRFENVSPPKSFKPTSTVTTSSGPDNRDFLSESRKNFVPLKAEPQQSFKSRAVYVPVQDNRDFGTETRDKLVGAGVNAKREPCRPAASKLGESVPFSGVSTHALDFAEHPTAVRRSFKPEVQTARAPEDRTFETENRGQLHFFSDAKPSASFKPAVNADMMPENRDFKSEARSNYGTKTGPPAAIVRPSRTTIESLPFDATTTARTDFPRFENVSPPKSFKPTSTVTTSSGPDNRDFLSESRKNFVPLKAEPQQSFKSRAVYVPVQDNRDFGTETRDKLVGAGVNAKREPYRPAATVQDSAPFNAESTHSLDFHAHPSAARRSFKPDTSSSRIGEDRDFLTDNRANFIQHPHDIYAANVKPQDHKTTNSIRYLN